MLFEEERKRKGAEEEVCCCVMVNLRQIFLSSKHTALVLLLHFF